MHIAVKGDRDSQKCQRQTFQKGDYQSQFQKRSRQSEVRFIGRLVSRGRPIKDTDGCRWIRSYGDLVWARRLQAVKAMQKVQGGRGFCRPSHAKTALVKVGTREDHEGEIVDSARHSARDEAQFNPFCSLAMNGAKCLYHYCTTRDTDHLPRFLE